MKLIVAICGRALAGKDTFAKSFIDAGYVELKFASALKQVIRTLFPTLGTLDHTDGVLKDTVNEHVGASPRELMQYIGTDLLQYGMQARFPQIGRGIFCGPVINAIALHERVVITDLRFMHEYEALVAAARDHGAALHVVRVERGKGHGISDEHESEIEHLRIPADVIIKNDASREALRSSAIELAAKLVSVGRALAAKLPSAGKALANV